MEKRVEMSRQETPNVEDSDTTVQCGFDAANSISERFAMEKYVSGNQDQPDSALLLARKNLKTLTDSVNHPLAKGFLATP